MFLCSSVVIVTKTPRCISKLGALLSDQIKWVINCLLVWGSLAPSHVCKFGAGCFQGLWWIWGLLTVIETYKTKRFSRGTTCTKSPPEGWRGTDIPGVCVVCWELQGNEEEQLFSKVKGEAGKCPSFALAMAHASCVMNHIMLFCLWMPSLGCFCIRDAPPSGKLLYNPLTSLLKLAYDLPLKLIIAIVIPALFHLQNIWGGLRSHFSPPLSSLLCISRASQLPARDINAVQVQWGSPCFPSCCRMAVVLLSPLVPYLFRVTVKFSYAMKVFFYNKQTDTRLLQGAQLPFCMFLNFWREKYKTHGKELFFFSSDACRTL